MTTLPISDYAMLSDRHSAALVSNAGSIDWLCFPRFDSPSVFAALIGDKAGHWSITPTESFEATRSYLPASMVLETTFQQAGGTAKLVDAMELKHTADPHSLGLGAPHTLLRGIKCSMGTVRIQVRYEPRPEYGLVVPVLSDSESGVMGVGGAGRLALSTPAPLQSDSGVAHAVFDLAEGDELYFALQYSALGDAIPDTYSQCRIAEGIDVTVSAWQQWSKIHQSYDGPWTEAIHHSGLVLQALSYQPTGAIVAAATTSLPEQIGGERNWDYRYSWIRDASFTLKALWVAACPDEAHEFFEFVTAAAAHAQPERPLQIMFGIGGEHDLSERILPQLSGWRNSRPVRVGNGAWAQPQLDVYGELLDAALLLRKQLEHLDAATRRFLGGLADAAAQQWRQKDNGIWEVRGEPQHFLYSKLMCWVALDRAVALAEQLHAGEKVEEWRMAADEIRDAILDQGWNDEVKAFTQSFGSSELDASALMLPIAGFLPASDARIRSTVAAIQKHLTDAHGLVYRYRTETGVDGVAGGEGSFLLCTFWLTQVLAMDGRTTEAREVCERALSYINDVGLLSEEVDAESGEQLGNFPQAFSHIGLINAAWAIHRAEREGIRD
ncbi:glycoside hydrolase family 15 protein [Arthrobacter sp. ISL-30]|uniref:glycoside hydrolase family 15 protein n=1 Tax=Arthrobacter sp. ISL-30 TaxID=2819109 RepID=UPI001BE64583|nr:glycoside hydrolase family 15 protein [Arthrobacter sp. ISL-30]MBT2514877.1 glycoside hydrolase family 15 protein [Arthrobacter sp. ISL-30]